MADDVDYLNNYIDGIEKNFPKMINYKFNNNLVRNINRKTIELVRDQNGDPLPFADISKKMKFDKVVGFPSEIEKDKYHNHFKSEEGFIKYQGLDSFNDYHKNFDDEKNARNKYMNYSKKPEFMNYLKNLVNKLKLYFPDVVKKNFNIYHILVFYLYPEGVEQDIHCDKFYLLEEDKKIFDEVDSLQIFIPLNDHELNSGPTIFYKKNMIDYDYIEKIGLKNKIWDENLKSDKKLTKMFERAKVHDKMYKGDLIFSDKDVFHKGGENRSNKIRKVLLIQLM